MAALEIDSDTVKTAMRVLVRRLLGLSDEELAQASSMSGVLRLLQPLILFHMRRPATGCAALHSQPTLSVASQRPAHAALCAPPGADTPPHVPAPTRRPISCRSKPFEWVWLDICEVLESVRLVEPGVQVSRRTHLRLYDLFLEQQAAMDNGDDGPATERACWAGRAHGGGRGQRQGAARWQTGALAATLQS